MDNFLKNIQIRNFKSVQQLDLDCKRVNVFVGKPNVGKSNILEALSLLGAHSSEFPEEHFLKDLVRYERIDNWFFDDDVSKIILVETNKTSLLIRHHPVSAETFFILDIPKNVRKIERLSDKELPEQFTKISADSANNNELSLYTTIDKEGYTYHVSSGFSTPFKPFSYQEGHFYDERSSQELKPPFGSNLFNVVDRNSAFRQEISEMFAEYGLEFVLSRSEGKFELQKKIDGIVYKYPYTGIADTFKRLIFYLAAIESNTDSVLILEEPEVHAFPPFTKQLADRITISTQNQFFLSTHSPYLLNTLIENLTDDELSVFLVYYENYQTKVHRMTAEDIKEVLDFSIDVFFNLDKFVNNGTLA